jgi:energy-coupling factor transporter ATP-binding protein EcfA2
VTRPALGFDRVTFAYGTRVALDQVSFEIAPGERVALLGRNGAGKSTLMRLVTGLLRARSGAVRVGDWDAGTRRPEELARRVGSLFQHADQQLFARTVADDVAFGPRATGVAEPEVARRVTDALGAMGLATASPVHPYDLPPAHRKLVALAGVLALEPSLFVLDEPTAGLDRRCRERVAAAMAAASGRGAALLVITHDLGFAAETLDRALVLEAGRLVSDGPLASLLYEAAQIERLGLVAPPVVRLSAALALPDRPLTEERVAGALSRRCRS